MPVKLTHTFIDNLKAEKKLYRKLDTLGNSFYVCVLPQKKTQVGKGTKTFQFRWRKPKLVNNEIKYGDTFIPLGRFGSVSLEDARLLSVKCHSFVKAGKDPHDALRQDVKVKKTITFEQLFDDWFYEKSGVTAKDFGLKEFTKNDYPIDRENLTFNSSKNIHTTMKDYVLPKIGNVNIGELEPLMVKEVLLKIQEGKYIKLKDGSTKFQSLLPTRNKARGWMKEIMDDAITLYPKEVAFNPVAGIRLKKKHTVKNASTVVKPQEIAEVFTQVAAFNKTTAHGQWQISLALNLLPLTGLRVGELCGLLWKEIDFKESIINIQGWENDVRRTKMGTPHTLPMSKQTTNILNKAKEMATKEGIKCKYVFPICNIKPDKDGFIHQHISISGIQNRLKLYIKIPGSILTPHGFRSMLKTRLKEGISQDGSTDMEDHNKYYSKELTEKALGHKDKVLEETYDRGEYLIRIKTMYQDWADYLDSLSSP